MDQKLINAVKKQLGDDTYLTDVNNGGADAGFPGFTYYTDTVKFFKQNKTEIVKLVKEYAEEFGQSPIEFVTGFNCLKGIVTEEEVATALYGHIGNNDVTVANALSWFALEEVARLEE